MKLTYLLDTSFIYFSMQSPLQSMHFLHLYKSEKISCQADAQSVSHVRQVLRHLWTFFPSRFFFNDPNRWQSEEARSRLWRGWDKTCQLHLLIHSHVQLAVWGVALSHCKVDPFVNRPGLYRRTDSRSWSSVSHLCELIVWPCGKNSKWSKRYHEL